MTPEGIIMLGAPVLLVVTVVIVLVAVWRGRRGRRARRRLTGTGSTYRRGPVDDRRAMWARRYGAGAAVWTAGGLAAYGAMGGLENHNPEGTGGCGGAGGGGCGGGDVAGGG
jgi:hypothetical protein